MMMMVIRVKPDVKENVTIEIWNYLLLVDIYFCNNNSKTLVCHNIGAFFPPQNITTGFLFYSNIKTKMLDR